VFQVPHFVNTLAVMQLCAFMLQGLVYLCGGPVSWFWTLMPLWLILGVCGLFWLVVLGVVRAIERACA